MNNKTRSIIKKSNDLANKFLDLATEFKALSKSIERTTDKKELISIDNILKHKLKHLEEYFDNVKGGLE